MYHHRNVTFGLTRQGGLKAGQVSLNSGVSDDRFYCKSELAKLNQNLIRIQANPSAELSTYSYLCNLAFCENTVFIQIGAPGAKI